ncbi:MAG: hypothetical protein KGO02_02005 [Alphaproteobacteria bacterium]|nr:hypothetical protein [Alphaproteobacteria bacterium]
MPTILVKNTKHQHLQWRNVTFPANGEILVDAILFNKLKNEFVPRYGSSGLVWDESKLQSALKQFKSDCFSEFESLGVSAVKASVEAGDLSRGDKHELALEWLAAEINQNPLNVWQRPIGAIWLLIVGGTLVLMVGYIFRHYFGVPL